VFVIRSNKPTREQRRSRFLIDPFNLEPFALPWRRTPNLDCSATHRWILSTDQPVSAALTALPARGRAQTLLRMRTEIAGLLEKPRQETAR
jgi:hypothetical protein